ncbi:MAG: 2-amino-4-hydroxy-6-hydroxymethyldihydropteridine diphosphokinase [Nitrospina sp.]|jgi:2-amino-4-hydroxy-6-hydroxymethyldihydropteridine diphosphokinase|nr:2-amino-4-hydroxy-6-hydroxymethyldihydropteridine diphosphokinase [Nitrospina sp.]
MSHKALIGIGSNLGFPAENCVKAISFLSKSKTIRVAAQSSLYESEPIGKSDQPWFVNAAVEVQTNLNPEELLQHLLKIEIQMGRVRKEKWGPRIIDLDILDYEGQIINSKTLTLPHPEMAQRRFVLEPLSEIAGATIHPLKNKTIADLLKEQPKFPVVKKLQPS